MLQREQILGLIEPLLEERRFFLISLDVTPSNAIRVVIDSMGSVTIEDCVAFSRAIEHNLDRDQDDFEIEVSSAGLSEPFRIREQYLKNIGKEIEVVLKNGRKEKGTLTDVAEDAFSIRQQKRVKVEGKKKKQLLTETLQHTFDECSKVKIVLKF